MKNIYLSLILLSLIGCANIPQPLEVKSDGYFPASKEIDQQYLLTNVKADKKYKIVFMREEISYRLRADIKEGYSTVHRQALLDMGFTVYNSEELIKLMQNHNIKTDRFLVDYDAVKKLQKVVGDIMVVDIKYLPENKEWNRYTIKASNLSEEVYFHISFLPFTLSSYEKGMVYPAFNRFVDWYRQ
ncbi:hypothetical protein N473_21535 [Pseudoalteromonas luteoviolacea CPMOR-1]|uniref:Lipoprotein n=1 Tax=Pseudoalteromonas luteoviolacea CPMOR-1 TaxID=1365248 RepID=A0A167K4P4_9GAMM|nr:hypothetical protein [Pseudoalteromonas luteoviolacea]KZN62131.1 hypothetical protein N473_21535 [Pseudoalteromonas luteoviolacea CPMOR-1]